MQWPLQQLPCSQAMHLSMQGRTQACKMLLSGLDRQGSTSMRPTTISSATNAPASIAFFAYMPACVRAGPGRALMLCMVGPFCRG